MTGITKSINLRQGFYRDSKDVLVYLSAKENPLNCQIEHPGQAPQAIPRSEIKEFTYVAAAIESFSDPEERAFIVNVLERELAKLPRNQARFVKNYIAIREGLSK